MSTINVEIKNLPQIRAAFGKAPLLMTANLNKAISDTINDIQSEELVQYPALGINVITGNLQKSIIQGTRMSNLRGEVGPNAGGGGVAYAGYVHDGTPKMEARPFLLEAINVKKNNIEDHFQKAVQRTLDQIGAMV